MSNREKNFPNRRGSSTLKSHEGDAKGTRDLVEQSKGAVEGKKMRAINSIGTHDDRLTSGVSPKLPVAPEIGLIPIGRSGSGALIVQAVAGVVSGVLVGAAFGGPLGAVAVGTIGGVVGCASARLLS